MKKCVCILILISILLCGCGTGHSADATAATTESVPAPTQSAEEVLAQRRDIVEGEMRRMMSVLWRSDSNIVYTERPGFQSMDYEIAHHPDRISTIVKGRIYSGLPYAHGSGSGDSFLSYSAGPDEDGIYTISGLGAASLSGNGSSDNARISNNCADAVFWAWARVSNSITFMGTSSMTESNGCIPVGSYDCSNAGFTYKRTKDITAANGSDVMYASYSKLQKADAVVQFNKEGHAMLISQVIVQMDGDAIHPTQSYVLVLDQISSQLKGEKSYYDESIGQTVYRCGGVDRKITFQELFDYGYLPVTCEELIDPSPLEEVTVRDSEKTAEFSNITKGSFTANYRISSVTITIYDKSGNVVQKATCFGKEEEMYRFQLSRFSELAEQKVLQGSLDLKNLAAGSYRCTHVCHVSTGEDIVVRDFTFDK